LDYGERFAQEDEGVAKRDGRKEGNDRDDDGRFTAGVEGVVESVGRSLSQTIAYVTGGRYTQVILDASTLRLTTELPETAIGGY
jgi:hypothetical protein